MSVHESDRGFKNLQALGQQGVLYYKPFPRLFEISLDYAQAEREREAFLAQRAQQALEQAAAAEHDRAAEEAAAAQHAADPGTHA